MKICPNCNNANDDANKMCTSCGSPLEEQAAPVVTQTAAPANDPNKTKAILALVFGIVALVLSWTGYGAIIALALAIAGVVLGSQARKAMPVGNPNRGLATAGYVTSLIVVILAAIMSVCAICVGVAACAATQAINESYGSELNGALNELQNALNQYSTFLPF